ncbi:hypothetical protein QOT17_013475 [Balamuthia mandrillaris]
MDWSWMLAEVMLDVFSRLDFLKDVTAVLLVCQTWNNLAKDRCLWRRWHDEYLGGPPCPPIPADGWRESFMKTVCALHAANRVSSVGFRVAARRTLPEKNLGVRDFCSPEETVALAKIGVAAQRGHPVLLRRLLLKHNELLEGGYLLFKLPQMCLRYAAENGHVTFLMQVFFSGDFAWTARELGSAFNLRVMLTASDSALNYAAKAGQEEVVQYLLSTVSANGTPAQANLPYSSDYALGQAVARAHLGIVRLLLPFYNLKQDNAYKLLGNVVRPLVRKLEKQQMSKRTAAPLNEEMDNRVALLNILFAAGLSVTSRGQQELVLDLAAKTMCNAVMECLFEHGLSPKHLRVDRAMPNKELMRFMLWHGAPCEGERLSELCSLAIQQGYRSLVPLLKNPPSKNEPQQREKHITTKRKRTVETATKQKEDQKPSSKRQKQVKEEEELETELRETYQHAFAGCKSRLDVFTLRGLLGKTLGSRKGLPQTKLKLLQALRDALLEQSLQWK